MQPSILPPVLFLFASIQFVHVFVLRAVRSFFLFIRCPLKASALHVRVGLPTTTFSLACGCLSYNRRETEASTPRAKPLPLSWPKQSVVLGRKRSMEERTPPAPPPLAAAHRRNQTRGNPRLVRRGARKLRVRRDFDPPPLRSCTHVLQDHTPLSGVNADAMDRSVGSEIGRKKWCGGT